MVETHPCPICGGNDHAVLFHRAGYPILRCARCTHRYAPVVEDGHVQRVYGDDYFGGGGAGYADYLQEGTLIRRRGRRYGRILRQFMSPGLVLDVGAAAGFFLQGLQDAGWRGCGIEPNARMVRYAREVLGLDLHQGTLEDRTIDGPFDLVTMVQVVPHFVNPKAALEAARDVTAEGGYWLIETWNCESLTARLFGRYWHEYSPPSVLHWFTPETLGRLVGALGFREVARGRLAKQLSAAHAKSLLKHLLGNKAIARPILAGMGLVPDRLAIPYPSEDLFWALYRRSS